MKGWLKAKPVSAIRGSTGRSKRHLMVDARAQSRRGRLDLTPACRSAERCWSSGKRSSGVMIFLYPVAMSLFNHEKEPRLNSPLILSRLRA